MINKENLKKLADYLAKGETAMQFDMKEFCFNSQWRFVDNTPQGAAARIYWLLEHGVPEKWRKQLEGKEPLCYLKEAETCLLA